MKSLTLLTLSVAACAFTGFAAQAQMSHEDDDSLSYRHTEVISGPDAAQMQTMHDRRGPGHEIPTIDDEAVGSTQSGVEFVTGGVGDDERAAIESNKGQYNFHLTNSRADGAFVEDTQITVKSKSGAQLLDVNAGPLLYAQLPAGTYMLDAMHGEEHKHQTFTIGGKAKKGKAMANGANLHLSWHAPMAAERTE